MSTDTKLSTNGRNAKLGPQSWVSVGLVTVILGLAVGAYDQVVRPLSVLQERVAAMSRDITEIRQSLETDNAHHDRELDRLRSKVDTMGAQLVDALARLKVLEK